MSASVGAGVGVELGGGEGEGVSATVGNGLDAAVGRGVVDGAGVSAGEGVWEGAGGGVSAVIDTKIDYVVTGVVRDLWLKKARVRVEIRKGGGASVCAKVSDAAGT